MRMKSNPVADGHMTEIIFPLDQACDSFAYSYYLETYPKENSNDKRRAPGRYQRLDLFIQSSQGLGT